MIRIITLVLIGFQFLQTNQFGFAQGATRKARLVDVDLLINGRKSSSDSIFIEDVISIEFAVPFIKEAQAFDRMTIALFTGSNKPENVPFRYVNAQGYSFQGEEIRVALVTPEENCNAQYCLKSHFLDKKSIPRTKKLTFVIYLEKQTGLKHKNDTDGSVYSVPIYGNRMDAIEHDIFLIPSEQGAIKAKNVQTRRYIALGVGGVAGFFLLRWLFNQEF